MRASCSASRADRSRAIAGAVAGSVGGAARVVGAVVEAFVEAAGSGDRTAACGGGRTVRDLDRRAGAGRQSQEGDADEHAERGLAAALPVLRPHPVRRLLLVRSWSGCGGLTTSAVPGMSTQAPPATEYSPVYVVVRVMATSPGCSYSCQVVRSG